MSSCRFFVFAFANCVSGGFVGTVGTSGTRRSAVSVRPTIVALTEPSTDETDLASPPTELINPATIAIGLAALAAFQPDMAMAKGGEFGIFEGRISSLAHPAVMATMYGASAFAGFTGLQWRRQRELGGAISGLKADRRPLQARLDAVEEGHMPPAALVAQVAALSTEIDEKSATRKELAGDDLRQKHYQVGSVILGLGTAFAIEGPVNTFMRAGKLFPGPHLYAGAGVVVAWAMAASLVPQMSQGKDWARNSHIAFNVLAFAFFTWQLPTGWEIALKVVEKTKFPW